MTDNQWAHHEEQIEAEHIERVIASRLRVCGGVEGRRTYAVDPDGSLRIAVVALIPLKAMSVTFEVLPAGESIEDFLMGEPEQ